MPRQIGNQHRPAMPGKPATLQTPITVIHARPVYQNHSTISWVEGLPAGSAKDLMTIDYEINRHRSPPTVATPGAPV